MRQLLACAIAVLLGSGAAGARAEEASNLAKPPGVPELTTALETLAKCENPAVKAYAKRLVEVFAKHKVPLPAALSDLTVPQAGVEALSEGDRATIGEATKTVYQFLDGAGAEQDQLRWYSALYCEVLSTVTEACPDRPTQFSAGLCLTMVASDGERSARLEIGSAARALGTMIRRALDTPNEELTDEIVAGIHMLSMGIIAEYIRLQALAAEEPTKAALDAEVDELARRAEAEKSAARAPNAVEAFGAASALLKELREHTEEIVARASATQEATRLTHLLIEAVNKGDTRAIYACMPGEAPPEAEAAAVSPSLFVKDPSAKALRLVAVRPYYFAQGMLRAIFHLEIIDEKGVARAWMEEIDFVKTDKGWKLNW
jgi:hypothetical protein